jgi:hypothetical protein
MRTYCSAQLFFACGVILCGVALVSCSHPIATSTIPHSTDSVLEPSASTTSTPVKSIPLITPSVTPELSLATTRIPSATFTPIPSGTFTDAPSATSALLPTQETRSPVPLEPIHGIQLDKLILEHINTSLQVGSVWTRQNYNWAAVETSNGQRNWQAVANNEADIVTASKAGINVILIMGGTPAWALKEGYSCGAIAPEQMENFGLFVFDAVQRYSAPPYNIRYWEFWNEPDVSNFLGCWGDENDPYYGGAYYAEMLKVAYLATKTANPDVQVLVGGLLLDCNPLNPPEIPGKPGEYKGCEPSTFLEGILSAGGGDYFDGVSFHAYDYYSGAVGQYSNFNWASSWNTTGPVLIAKANYLRQLLSKYGFANKYLMNTEVAVMCGRDGTEAICQTQDYQLTKAYYAAEAYVAALSQNIKNNIWYSLLGWRGSGLVKPDLTPLPAYQAFAFSRKKLENVTYLLPEFSYDTDEDDITNIIGYRFEKDTQQIWMVWSNDGADHAITLPETPIGAYDVFGNPLSVTGSLWTVTIAPVYLEFAR